MSSSEELTKKDFEIFVKEALKWVEILGLKSWEWHFVFGKCSEDSRAEYHVQGAARIVTVWLNDFWDDIVKKSNEEIKKTAFHEVTEVMMYDLRGLALRDSNYTRVDVATHKIVRTLENVLFPKYSK